MFESGVLSEWSFLEQGVIREIERHGVIKSYGPGDELIREGQFISSFPIILSGLLKVLRRNKEGDEILLYYLKPKEVCSMSITCCLSETKSNIFALAELETTVILIETVWLEKWMIKYPTWKKYIMTSIQARFGELLETVDAIAFMKMDQRLVQFFRNRAEKTGITNFSGSHQELAYQLNTSREVISRILKKLEKLNKVKLSRNFVDFSSLL